MYKPLVPILGVNYPNWVMGPFDLGNGPFFIRVLTTTYFIEQKSRLYDVCFYDVAYVKTLKLRN